MNMPSYPDQEFERRVASRLMDVLIRAGLIVALAALCYRVFSPFLTLMVWALILAVAMYPLHLGLAARVGNRQGLAATLLVLIGIVLIVVPAGFLMSLLGDSVKRFIEDVQANNLQIPAPPASVESWPIVGGKLHALWSTAHADLPALVQSMQPKIGDLAKGALAFVASIGVGLLQFLASFIVAGIIMAFGESGARAMRSIFKRIFGGRARRGIRHAVHANHPGRRQWGDRRGLHSGDHHRAGADLRRGALGRGADGDRAGAGHRPGARADRHPARDRLYLGKRRLRNRRRDRLYRVAGGLGHGRQRAEAAAAGPWGRCTDAGHPDWRARRHGGRGHPRDVRRRDPARAGLSDLHGLGGLQSGHRRDATATESPPAS